MKIALVMHPVQNLDTALRFYGDTIGLPTRFRDGDRFAALDAGGVTLALVARDERILDTPALAWQVEDIEAAIARLIAAGARVVQPPEKGPHEWRAVLRDVDGHPLVLAARLAA